MTTAAGRAFDPDRRDEGKAFSVSRLNCYGVCPRQYHYRYLDRLPREGRSVEAHLGSSAHSGLEALYRSVQHGRVPAQAEVLAAFEAAWEGGLEDGPVVVRDKQFALEDYRSVGRECVKTYYRGHEPFDEDKTVGVELRVGFPLRIEDPEAGAAAVYRIEGIVDRLALAPDGAFEIHDYKTSASLPTAADLAEDWQLAVYNLAVLESWPDTTAVRLKWHYLRFGKTLTVVHDRPALESVRARLVERILAVKRDRAFEPVKNPLCDWCDYRDVCPLWKHLEAYKLLPPEERRQEGGVELADAYAALEAKRKGIKEGLASVEAEQEELSARILRYADEKGVRALAGTDCEVEVHSSEEHRFPTRTREPERLKEMEDRLKAASVWGEVSRLDPRALMDGFAARRWPAAVMALVEGWLDRWIRRETVRTVRLRRRREAAAE